MYTENLFIYICISIWLLGYLCQYTTLCIFTWMTAMTLEISTTVTKLRLKNNASYSNYKFVTTFFIAQGLPAVVSVATAVIDSYGPGTWILPGVGVHRCFLQSRAQFNNYFADPFFIYFFVFIILLISLNLMYFLKLLIHLIRHWVCIQGMESVARNNALGRLRLVARCFFIMGMPMILILTANVLEFVNGKKNLLIVQLNMIALLSGFYMFVTLVCKKTVLKELKIKCSSLRVSWSYGSPRLLRLISNISTSNTSVATV